MVEESAGMRSELKLRAMSSTNLTYAICSDGLL